MKTIKKGDKGAEVKMLQELLNKAGHKLVVDSDFGQKTHDAVVALQKSKSLEADGIVGPKTWASLCVGKTTTNTKCVDESVIYEPLELCISKSPNRVVKYLAIHYTAGGSSAHGKAKSMKGEWERSRRVSADFGVDDSDMVQFNPDIMTYHCWAVGDGKNSYSGGGQLYGKALNRNTVSIEICSSLQKGYTAAQPNHDGWYFTESALDNAVKLAKILMKKFNIPIERVVRHYDISGKVCPGIIGWNNAEIYTKEGKITKEKNNSKAWEAFKKRLSNA